LREITKIHGESGTIVEGVSGSFKNIYVANRVGLQFGNVRLGNLDMLSFDTTSISEGTGTEVSGFLGFEVLQLLTAVPLSRMKSGVRAFCTDQSGNVFHDLNGSASECLAVGLLLP
jgi:hypothetical protein